MSNLPTDHFGKSANDWRSPVSFETTAATLVVELGCVYSVVVVVCTSEPVAMADATCGLLCC
jgi:hypothetical protein